MNSIFDIYSDGVFNDISREDQSYFWIFIQNLTIGETKKFKVYEYDKDQLLELIKKDSKKDILLKMYKYMFNNLKNILNSNNLDKEIHYIIMSGYISYSRFCQYAKEKYILGKNIDVIIRNLK